MHGKWAKPPALHSNRQGGTSWRTATGSDGSGHPAARMARARAARARKLRGRARREPGAGARGVHRHHARAWRPRRTPAGRALPQGSDGDTIDSPLVFTDVRMGVSGMIARVTVEQRFVNPTDEWREGVYVFPLPEKAAVDHLRMKVGERVSRGHDQGARRGEAHLRNREERRPQGHAGRQERPNLFTTSVANIGPHEEIVVAIEYQETLRYDEGTFRLRFPLAITPRYIPATPSPSRGGGVAGRPRPSGDRRRPHHAAGRRRAATATCCRCTSRSTSTPAFRSPSCRARITRCASRRNPATASTSRWPDGPVPAARDFELTWTPDVGAAPGAALFTETKGRQDLRAADGAAAGGPRSRRRARPPREVTYIIDTSGSMEGVSMVQARDALLLALDRLQPGDRFNVIEFNSTTRSLFAAPVPLDGATLTRAKQFVGRPARARRHRDAAGARDRARRCARSVDAAPGRVPDRRRGRQRRRKSCALVNERIGDRRLFTVGIGPAPNMFFMTKAAQFGRGTYTPSATCAKCRRR